MSPTPLSSIRVQGGHTKDRILRTIPSAPYVTKKEEDDIPLRNLLPEVSDAWASAWGRWSGVDLLTHCILVLYDY
jgi:hypothetical protein